MENTTKALLMAGSVLISILVVSFIVLVLRRAGMMSLEHDQQMSDVELESFNSQFEYYNRPENNFFDIITVSNLAYDVNERNANDETNSVTINIFKEGASNQKLYRIAPNLEKKYFFEGDSTNIIYMYDEPVATYAQRNDEGNDYVYKFDCIQILYSDITGKVKKMDFKTIRN